MAPPPSGPAFIRIHDRFRLTRELGRGATGEVYLADDLAIGRQVAIKLLRISHRDDLLLREARAAGRLTHPHIAAIFDVGKTDDDVWDPSLFAGSTHVTPAERQALAGLRALGLHDVVPTPMKGPHPFTYWDYRAGMFHQNKGMRIDLVYAGAGVAGRVRSAYVDREARKGKRPSDHAPIVVDLDPQD